MERIDYPQLIQNILTKHSINDVNSATETHE